MKHYLIAASILLPSALKAQDQGAMRIGVESGFNIANVNETVNSSGVDHRACLGVRAGASVDIPLTKGESNISGKLIANTNLHLQPGVTYAMEGYRNMRQSSTDRLNVNTLQLPVWLNLKFGNGTHNRFYAGIAPVFILRLSGTFTPDVGSTTRKKDVHFGVTATELKRYDVAAGVNAGYEFTNGLFVRLAWQYGLINTSNVKTVVSPNSFETKTSHAYSYLLSFGCFFGARSKKA